MKKAVLLLVFLFATAATQIISQPLGRMGFNSPGVQQLITQYGDELQLTEDQKSQLIQLQMEHRKQFQTYGRRSMNGRGNRGHRNFRGNRPGTDQGSMMGPGYCCTGFGGANWQSRLDMRNEVLDILTDDQRELLQDKMLEQAESAHEFRTLRHEYIVSESGIEGDKAAQVLDLLNAQSEVHLNLAKQRIINPGDITLGQLEERFQQMRNTHNELRNFLSVDEYDNLRQNMGFGYAPGFGSRPQRNGGRGYRMWNR